MSTSHSVQEIVLAERVAELAVLHDAFRRCADGKDGVVVAVEGPPSTGRTSLLRAFTRQIAASGALVLTATCSRLERDLPLAVVHQLLQGGEADTPDTLTGLVEGAMGEPNAVDRLITPARQATLALLRRLVTRRRLVVVIDDAHHMDAASAHCLLFAQRRLRPAQVLFVLSQTDSAAHRRPPTQKEWAAQPDYRTIRLRRLTESGVRKVVASRLGDVRPHFAASCHAITGGNPRLVQAVLDDHLAQAESSCDPVGLRDPEPGEFYDRAVLNCLHRASPAALRIARATAILTDTCESALLGKLVGLQPNAVEAGSAELTATGLLHEGRFRHDRSRPAVLASMTAVERAELHRRAAELLHYADASNRTVVEHVIAAGTPAAPWAIDVLIKAARVAASEHDAEFAKHCLELSACSTTDERLRARTHTMLLDIMWRIDPRAAEPYVASLTATMRAGRLDVDDTVTLIKHHLWCGRISAAADALTWLNTRLDDPEAAASSSVRILWLWLAHSFPKLAPLLRAPSSRADGEPVRGALLNGIDARLRSADTLTLVLANRSSRHVLLDSRQVLQSQLCHDLSFETVHSALLTLLYAEHVAESAEWCDLHLTNAAKRDGSPCHFILMALRAEISLRSGDLPAAEELARTAVRLFREGRGSAVSELPLSTLLTALVRLGRLDDAAEVVHRPVPMGFLPSRAGLTYRCAVGQFRLATDAPKAALEDFLDCGSSAVAWNLDAPTLVPWREGAAEALHRMGQTARAEELLRGQLELIGDRFPRVRGTTLRVLAGMSPRVAERKELLTEAVELLRGAGAGYELARVMLDLATVYGTLGAARRARMETRLAHEVANECGATTLVPFPRLTPSAVAAPERQHEGLSHAERRVAFLAARGHTNREIAEQLFITRSTVEQHLTRVFRKLKVRQREDLPLSLGLHKPDRVCR
ncbi:LuxR family transcriptional regulator [Streptomyces sp. SID3343]|uniref:AAA family ATPase n=1 Tax=Streptomyces sp. SID3343 TaxID=2690260 RepID=UPI00136C3DDE|nr:LuxR family transcriptional regulator [Streptomyces sp. SID3343]MYW01791.1 AAA family ATPase [Streptomyces sp. SID3343]